MVVGEQTKVGVRMGLGVLITSAIGFAIIAPRLESDSGRSAVESSTRAAAITTVVVNAPVIGKVAQVGLDRTVGTVLGGLTGYLVFWLHQTFLHRADEGLWEWGAILSFAAFWAAWGSVEAGWYVAKLQTTPRLFTLTYILIVFGAHSTEGSKVVMISRIAGICAGAVVSLVLAVVVFPESATIKCLQDTRCALKTLVDLSEAAWPQRLLPPMQGETPLERKGGGFTKLSSASGGHWQHEDHLTVDQHCEKLLMAVFSALERSRENVPYTEAEIYLFTIRGRMVFFPGLPLGICRGTWSPDLEALGGLQGSISRTSRLLWVLHLSFQDGFSSEFARVMRQQYPDALLDELRESCQGALQDLLDAFPSHHVHTANLMRFSRAVEGMLRISDYHRRELMQAMRASKKPGERVSSPCADEALPASRQPLGWWRFLPRLRERQPDAPASSSGRDTPVAAFADLPQGLSISVRSPESKRLIARLPSLQVDQGSEGGQEGSTTLRINPASLSDDADFPLTAEGQLAHVRWSSFQFLAEELVESVQDMHHHLCELATSMPCSNIVV